MLLHRPAAHEWNGSRDETISRPNLAGHQFGPRVIRDPSFDGDRYEPVVLKLPDVTLPRAYPLS